MNRSFVSVLLSLACFSTFPVLAQSTGLTQAVVNLSAGANPTASGISLTGTVQPETAGNVPRPGGAVTFLDGGHVLNTNGASLTPNASLLSQTFAQVFGMLDPALGSTNLNELSGDFDGDGRNDLIVYAGSTATSMKLQVFLTSNPGQGNFRALASQTLTFTNSVAFATPAVLDVDGDGKLDLLIGNTVAYGNGDGTFSRVAILPILSTGFDQTYAVDMNGDGKLDIVAVNTPPAPTQNSGTVQFTFTVFRNDGSGTFTSLGTFPLAPSFQTGVNLCCDQYNIFGLSFADLNGDGKIDVLSQSNAVPQSSAPVQFNVMLNNDDGTFGSPKSVDTSALNILQGAAVALGDVNGDGKADMIMAYPDYRGQNYLAGALGNGDGTFKTFSQLLLINYLTAGIANPQLQLIDFDNDGKLDAIVGSGEVALGKGDGTFTLATPLFAQPANPQTPLNYPLLQMPIYAHSSPSLVYLNLTSGANAVFTPQDSSSATVKIMLAAGLHTLLAQYSGDNTYAAGTSPAINITVAPAVTTLTLSSSANPSYTGQSIMFTATIAGLAPGGGGTVTFSNGSTTLGTATVSNGTASYTGSLSTAGNQTITAAYSGDANNAASSATLAQTVNAPFTVAAGSGGSTTLTVASGQSATAQVAVSGAAGFTGTVDLSCTGLPVHAACSFSPATVTLAGSAAVTSTMTVSTGATTTASARDGEPLRSATVLVCGLPLLGLAMLLPVARGRRLLLCVGFLLFVSVTGIAGCGGSSPSNKTPSGSYSFQVVATSGSASSTANYKLTVQ